MKKFCKDLKKNATKIINYGKKKKEMTPLKSEENKSYRKQKVCYIYQKHLVLKMKIKNAVMSEITVITLENVEKLLIISVI